MHQELGCGTVSLHDAEEERLRTVHFGQMPESKKAALCQELEAEVRAILVRPRLRVVKLADGAGDNWRFLGKLNLGVPTDAERGQVAAY